MGGYKWCMVRGATEEETSAVDPARLYQAAAGSIWKISVLPSQFCCKLKSALKNKVF